MADLRLTRRGRPRKHWRVRGAVPVTPEQERTQEARELYEGGGCSLNKAAKKFGFTSGTISYLARIQSWRRPEPDREPERQIGQKVSSADLIALLTLSAAPARETASVAHLPDWTSEEKTRPSVTPATIRDAMAIEMVAQIDRYEALLERYSRLLEVYLRPDRFVDNSGLTEDQWAERVAATRKEALRTLVPTKRETLAGVVKTLTEGLASAMHLKRAVLELEVAAAGTRPAGSRNPVGGRQAMIAPFKDMSPEELEKIQRARELLKRHFPRNREPPMPPPPEPVDDLLRPDASRGAGPAEPAASMGDAKHRRDGQLPTPCGTS